MGPCAKWMVGWLGRVKETMIDSRLMALKLTLCSVETFERKTAVTRLTAKVNSLLAVCVTRICHAAKADGADV